MKPNQSNDPDRRKFVSTLTKVMGSAMFLSASRVGYAQQNPRDDNSWTVGQIMDLFISEVPGTPFDETVDTLKAGDRDIRVTGIVTSMFPTVEVIQKAIALNANFIIVHEPTFYNHRDNTSWLANDPVYRYKADLLKKHNIAVWRNHDYIHRHKPDGVLAGVVKLLKWERFASPANPHVFELPSATLGTLVEQLKAKFEVPQIRYIGDLSESCQKILLMPGAMGGRNQITGIEREKPEVLICGEISEWETAEYVRDARAKGDKLALVVLGHVASEEPGSAFMADWLKERVKNVKTTHVPAGNSLMFA